MIALVEALHFRCLRFVRTPLERLQILVGPNASGKTTFLDALAFLGTLVREGPEAAFEERTRNPIDLLWGRRPGFMELAIEAILPEEVRTKFRDNHHSAIRYEVSLEVEPETYQVSIRAERALLKAASRFAPVQRELFPDPQPPPPSILLKGRPSGTRVILNKVPGGNDNFYSEVYPRSGKGWAPSYKLGPRRSTLGNLPAEEEKFPASTWLRDLLKAGVRRIMLNSLLLRQASPPGLARSFSPDGSNLPWIVQDLKEKHSSRFQDWLAHVRTALPDVEDIRVVVRQDDRHAYLMLRYAGGLEAPSWVISDGTLRLLALTILGYLPSFHGVFLIEEPENGIHPTAVETVYESLCSLYTAQALVASHSPVLLNVARPEQLLCFGRDEHGAVDVVRGDQHPALADWRRDTPLGVFLASGILG